MNQKKTSIFENALIWFGAGVSLAEIQTGMELASIGIEKGILAIIIGHIIGCVLLFLAGLIGGYTGRSSMECAALSFGKKGAALFAILNILQLLGWTGIMIYDGAIAAESILHLSIPVWACIIGGLIIVWILVGIQNLGKINTIAMAALFILSVVLCFSLKNAAGSAVIVNESLSFGQAVELSIAMPLSWFPLIADYTREAEKPFAATLASSVVYGMISTWMFVIGLAAAVFTQGSDLAMIMVQAGLGIAGLLIVVFSTVTTTFLDAYSAGVSSVTISDKINEKHAGVVITVIGIIGASLINMDNISDFLYLIGSVFAPMVAIMICDYFLVHHDAKDQNLDISRLIIWVLGFVLYRILLGMDLPLGSTIWDMGATILLTLIIDKVSLSFRH